LDFKTAEAAATATATTMAAMYELSVEEARKVLGLTRGCTLDDVKEAYKQKARETHPDRHRDDPNATAKFQKVSEAYQLLSNPSHRKAAGGGKKQTKSSRSAAGGGDDKQPSTGDSSFDEFVSSVLSSLAPGAKCTFYEERSNGFSATFVSKCRPSEETSRGGVSSLPKLSVATPEELKRILFEGSNQQLTGSAIGLKLKSTFECPKGVVKNLLDRGVIVFVDPCLEGTLGNHLYKRAP
jgi:curved DNA-binding protein CbpA